MGDVVVGIGVGDVFTGDDDDDDDGKMQEPVPINKFTYTHISDKNLNPNNTDPSVMDELLYLP